MSDQNNTVQPQALSVLDFDNLTGLLSAYESLAFLLPNDNLAANILGVLNQSFSNHLDALMSVAEVR